MSRRAALLLLVTLGCEPTATVGTYTDGGMRCDPLGSGCGPAMACSLRADPALDACREVQGLAPGTRCLDPDACESGSQCVAIGAESASLAADDLDPGTCARVCARDAPDCPGGERCLGLLASAGGVRIDYGVCAP